MKTITFFFLVMFSTISYSQINFKIDVHSGVEVNHLVGFNTGFNHRHMVITEVKNGKKIFTSQIKPKVLEAFDALKYPVMRFPGGVIANFYHLYPEGFDCDSADEICEDMFAKGYGLRRKELATGRNNPLSEWKFENDNEIEDNWIVAFANLIERQQQRAGDTVPIVFMINVLSNFSFDGRPALFVGNRPDTMNPAFQRNLEETRHALRYLMEVRHLSVIAVELGTELYFNKWSQYHGVDIDKFISLIPIYRKLIDDLGYHNIRIGVPVFQNHQLGPKANNWTRKLVDASYNPNQMYDDWIIHDYYDMVEPCTATACNKCKSWVDDECSLYTSNVNGPVGIVNCDPAKHSPSSTNLEKVFRSKINRFGEAFNGDIAGQYASLLMKYRSLSKKQQGVLWLTEWNHHLDNGCDRWKGINRFFANTFLHAVNMFELLHSFNEKNRQMDNTFMKVSNFHSFIAKNINNPILKVDGSNLYKNATYYPFLFSSQLALTRAEKVDIKYLKNAPIKKEVVLHAYTTDEDSIRWVYLYYSNKTHSPQKLNMDIGLEKSKILNIDIKYVQAEALHSSANFSYTFNPKNVTVQPMSTTYAEAFHSIDKTVLPPLSFGILRLKYSVKGLGTSGSINIPKHLMIYPNPAGSKVWITVPFTDDSPTIAQIVNITGKTVVRFRLAKDGEARYIIDVSQLPKGLYWIRLMNEKQGVYSTKLIKK